MEGKSVPPFLPDPYLSLDPPSPSCERLPRGTCFFSLPHFFEVNGDPSSQPYPPYERSTEECKAKRKEEVKPGSVNHEIVLLKQMFTKATECGKLNDNPTKSMKL